MGNNNDKKPDLKHLIWIDSNFDNDENKGYMRRMKDLGFSNIRCFKTTEEGINYIKTIHFESTKIILSGRLYIEFIKKFKKNINNLYLIPKIAIFTGDKTKFIEYNKAHKVIIDPFYNYGKINESYEEIKKFLMKNLSSDENKTNNINENNAIKSTLEKIYIKEKLGVNNNIQLTFEYVDCIEKLELPLLYQSIINLTKIDKIESYNEYLYSNY